MEKCIKCGGNAVIVKDRTGLYYVRCDNCTKWDKYQFLGAKKENAIKQWNVYNTKGNSGWSKNGF